MQRDAVRWAGCGSVRQAARTCFSRCAACSAACGRPQSQHLKSCRLPPSLLRPQPQPFGASVHVVEVQAASSVEQQQDAGQQDAALEAAVSQRLEGQQPEDGALIIYTSGTTGRPKGELLVLMYWW